jgi:hypothetical protein
MPEKPIAKMDTLSRPPVPERPTEKMDTLSRPPAKNPPPIPSIIVTEKPQERPAIERPIIKPMPQKPIEKMDTMKVSRPPENPPPPIPTQRGSAPEPRHLPKQPDLPVKVTSPEVQTPSKSDKSASIEPTDTIKQSSVGTMLLSGGRWTRPDFQTETVAVSKKKKK